MNYILDINISTDGDFWFPFVPRGMEYCESSQQYELGKTYTDLTAAITDITRICTFLKEQVQTNREWVKKDFIACVDNFSRHIINNTDSTYIHEYMDGNYFGTEFTFSVNLNRRNFSLTLSDEELEIIRKNEKAVTAEQIKDAVVALYT